MEKVLEEYRSLVKVIKDDDLTESIHKNALEDLIRLFAEHVKENRTEALKFTKGAVLHLFKNGKLRGLTENLKGLKPVYIGIMRAISEKDMHTIGLDAGEINDFYTLLDKLNKELEFIEHSNDELNYIAGEGLDDEVYGLKS